jgi:hypothetical protein
MSIRTFGVTHTIVRGRYFPQLGAFTQNSNPSLTRVTEAISDAAADLAGKLAMEGLDAGALEDGILSYPNAYAWCAKTIRLATAIELLPVMSHQDPEVVKAWRVELKDRYKALDDFGYVALGDAPAPSTPSNGPITHINRNDLELSDSDDMSSVIPTFRRDDVL